MDHSKGRAHWPPPFKPNQTAAPLLPKFRANEMPACGIRSNIGQQVAIPSPKHQACQAPPVYRPNFAVTAPVQPRSVIHGAQPQLGGSALGAPVRLKIPVPGSPASAGGAPPIFRPQVTMGTAPPVYKPFAAGQSMTVTAKQAAPVQPPFPAPVGTARSIGGVAAQPAAVQRQGVVFPLPANSRNALPPPRPPAFALAGTAALIQRMQKSSSGSGGFGGGRRGGFSGRGRGRGGFSKRSGSPGRGGSKEKQQELHGPSGKEILPVVARAHERGRGRGRGGRGIGERPIVIGVTNRDSGGVQNQLDVMTVELGTGCVVRVINSLDDVPGVHGFFIPGGMADLPDTLSATGAVIPARDLRVDTRGQEAWLRRVELQRQLARIAISRNLPMLGVCGGSRALAQAVGGFTQYLDSTARDAHNQHFGSPWHGAHTVDIDRSTTLGTVIEGGHYLRRRPELRDQSVSLTVNSMHWAQSGFGDRAGQLVTVSGYGDEDVVEGWELREHPFFVGVQWHPEFAQIGEGDFTDDTAPHQRVMGALGQAAQETVAATILQAYIRAHLAAKCTRLIAPLLHDIEYRLTQAKTTRARRFGELDNPLTLALFKVLYKVDEFLAMVRDLDLPAVVPELWAATRGRALAAVKAVKKIAWADESISVEDAQAIDEYIVNGFEEYGALGA